MCLVTQLCPTLCDLMDYSLPGSSVHGIFSRQEYWSVLPFPSPGHFPHPGIKSVFPAFQVDPLLSEPLSLKCLAAAFGQIFKIVNMGRNPASSPTW